MDNNKNNKINKCNTNNNSNIWLVVSALLFIILVGFSLDFMVEIFKDIKLQIKKIGKT